jgi:hypothetical protein
MFILSAKYCRLPYGARSFHLQKQRKIKISCIDITVEVGVNRHCKKCFSVNKANIIMPLKPNPLFAFANRGFGDIYQESIQIKEITRLST